MNWRKSIKKLTGWLDKYLLPLWAAWLFLFIPLYPKLPLVDILPGYIVRIRLEDIFIGFAWILIIYQLVKKRLSLRRVPLLKPIMIYLLVGLASCLSALFITRTVPLELIHVAKLWLHYFRRIEYFSLFFIFYFAVKQVPAKHRAKSYWLFLPIILAVAAYGFGQRYLYWPVFLTMNREFSKGMVLYLTEHARVSSTFGGHYDLAAFLVMAMPIVLALYYGSKKIWLKLLFLLAFIASLWLMILTASRTSFIAYLVAIVVLFIAYSFKKGFQWSFFRCALIIFFSLFIMVQFGDLYDRYAHLIEGVKEYPKACFDTDLATGSAAIFFEETKLPGRLSLHEKGVETASQSAVCQVLIKTNQGLKKINKNLSIQTIMQDIIDSPVLKRGSALMAALREKLTPEVKEPEPELAVVVTKTDVVPVPTRPLPPDVYEDIPEVIETPSPTPSVALEASPTAEPTPKSRTYSENAYTYGLSAAIRLDALWPRAIDGFKRNPLLGSGYSTLTKEKVTDFTEAESTDNDFLRMLGETGLLGLVSFMAILGIVFYQAARTLKLSQRPAGQFFAGAVIAFLVGLLINAIYIDVFEASKVAYMLWAVIGIFFATQVELKMKNTK